MSKNTQYIPKVAILVGSSTGWGRRLIRGILSWTRECGPWHVWVEPSSSEEDMSLPDGWDGDGIIARVSSLEMQNSLKKTGIPVINISAIELPGPQLYPRVTTNILASAELAFKHFQTRGFTNFAYIGNTKYSYVNRHYEAFQKILHKKGYPCVLYRPTWHMEKSFSWYRHVQDLIPWLNGLPRPVGIFTWGSEIGRVVIDACLMANILVPHEIAVLGGDYDELLSDASYPSQSGVVTPAEIIGRQAARALHSLMQGQPIDGVNFEIMPQKVVMRQSTDTIAINDSKLVKALQFIRDHSAEPITVNDIADAVPIPRRSLEHKFEKCLGCTPIDELRRIRISKARNLLASTDLTMPEIANACGFSTYNYLSLVFKKATGLSPLSYRKQSRSGYHFMDIESISNTETED